MFYYSALQSGEKETFKSEKQRVSLYVDHNCDIITNFCVFRALSITWLFDEKEGRRRRGREGRGGEGEKRGEKRLPFFKPFLKAIYHALLMLILKGGGW